LYCFATELLAALGQASAKSVRAWVSLISDDFAELLFRIHGILANL
jgi:hypothetical protein